MSLAGCSGGGIGHSPFGTEVSMVLGSPLVNSAHLPKMLLPTHEVTVPVTVELVRGTIWSDLPRRCRGLDHTGT